MSKNKRCDTPGCNHKPKNGSVRCTYCKDYITKANCVQLMSLVIKHHPEKSLNESNQFLVSDMKLPSLSKPSYKKRKRK